jgi:hypothetical protein
MSAENKLKEAIEYYESLHETEMEETWAKHLNAAIDAAMVFYMRAHLLSNEDKPQRIVVNNVIVESQESVDD